MRKRIGHLASLLLLPALLVGPVTMAATQPSRNPPAAGEPAIQPQARDALVRTGQAVASLSTFSVHEEITRDQVINGDLEVQKSSVADVTVRRPDRLRSDVVSDEADRSHSTYYDGKTLTIFHPATKYYAQMDAPGTIGATIEKAESQFGIEFPLADLLRMASADELAADLTAAGDVGPSRIAGVDCEHYAYRTKSVDYQLWIENGDRSLPRKVVITSKNEPHQPQFSAVLAWNTSPKIDDGMFVFTPPAGATKIPFGAAAASRSATQPGKK